MQRDRLLPSRDEPSQQYAGTSRNGPSQFKENNMYYRDVLAKYSEKLRALNISCLFHLYHNKQMKMPHVWNHTHVYIWYYFYQTKWN